MELTGADFLLQIPEGVLPMDDHPALAGVRKFRREQLGVLSVTEGRSFFENKESDQIYQIPNKSTGYFSVNLCRSPDVNEDLNPHGIISVNITVKNPVDGSDYDHEHVQEAVRLSLIPPCSADRSDIGQSISEVSSMVESFRPEIVLEHA